MPMDSLLTLSDIAALAHVQRPVVSMWRTRFAGTDHPFPAPTARDGRRETFLVEDVVSWLEDTGHGNNDQARLDAAAAVALDLLPPTERATTVDGLHALVCLKALVGTPLAGLAAPDLLDLADDVDPHDTALYREIAALGHDAADWAEHADALASAAFTPADAAAGLLASHVRLGLTDVANAALGPTALDFVGRLVEALLPPDAVTDPVLHSPNADAALLLAFGARRGDPATAALPRSGTTEGRRARRALLAAGWQLVDARGDEVPAATSLVLVQLPCATLPDLSDAEVVDALGELEATLPAHVPAIVVGPAPALCGRLPHELQAARATVLRSGRVRAVVRLPAGLWPARPRQSLGLWLLGPGPTDVRAGDHRTAVADLRGAALDTAAVEDLVTDLATACDLGTAARGHAFRFTRFAVTTSLVAASGDLVTGTAPSRRPRADAAALALALSELYAAAADPTAPLPSWLVKPEEAAGPVTVTLGRLVELGHLRVVPGNRIDDDDLRDDGAGVRVLTPAALAGGPVPTVDRLHLAAAYPRSRYTRPGDVVLCSAPRPAAVVDADGWSVVASPARVLRLTRTAPAGLLPEVIAHAATVASRTAPWRLWQVPLVPAAQADATRRALREISAARADVAARLTTLDALAAHLVEALTSGSVSLIAQPRTSEMEG